METKRYFADQYQQILQLTDSPKILYLGDHLGGFNEDRKNIFLDHLHHIADGSVTVYHDQVVSEQVKKNYPKLNFQFKLYDPIWTAFTDYNIHPDIRFKNFVCSFNGSAHVSRKLLVSILEKFQWFNPTYCSKNFSYSVDVLDGHISDCVGAATNFYCKFFISTNSENFFQSIYSFGHVQYDHASNIYNLENKLTESFLHVVSETMATSYQPFVSEKFLYSTVTRGLFLAYAQPGWHAHLEKYYGFKRYTKLFDYRFDSIQNPVERLVELMSMIAKFSVLSVHDWRDLYLLQQDEIEYNYHHYFSQDYLKCLAKYS